MNRIKFTTNSNPHFIGAWNILDDNLCKSIIDFFINNPELQIKGTVGAGGIDEKVKKTTDMTIYPNNLKNKSHDVFNLYFKRLNECFLDYREQFPYLKSIIQKVNIGPFNIQKYQSGDHFSKIHSERTDIICAHRIFAWMTYLNDVDEDDGGTTDFDFYKIKIRPECGKTLIWPAEWTHAHSGSLLKRNKKYIITGWIDFKV